MANKITKVVKSNFLPTTFEGRLPVYAERFNALVEGLNDLGIADDGNLTPASVTITKGTVTQLTNITTAVTVNASAGVITTVALTTAGGATSGPFTVNNSYVTSTSTIILTPQYASGKTGNPIVMTEGTPGTGTFKIKVGNGAPAATVLNDVVKIHFLIV